MGKNAQSLRIAVESSDWKRNFLYTSIKTANGPSLRVLRLKDALSAAKRALIHAADEKALLREVCELVVQRGGFFFVAIGQADPTTKSVRLVAMAGGIPADDLRALSISSPADVAEGCGPMGASLREQRTVISADFQRDPTTQPWHELANRLGIRSCMAIPVRRDGHIFGALEVVANEPDAFDAEVVALLEEFAGDMSRALDHCARDAERIRAAKALRESEARFATLTRLSSDWYWERDEAGRFTQISEQLFAQSGVLPSALIGKTAQEAGLRYDSADRAALDVLLAARRPFRDVELARLDANGTRRVVSISGQPMFDEAGGFTGYRGVGQDITDRKLAESRLRQAELAIRNKAKQQRLLAAFSQSSLTGTDIDTIIAAAARAVADGLDVDFANVLQLSHDGQSLIAKAVLGGDEGWMDPDVSSAAAGTQNRFVLDRRDAVIIDDYRHETRFTLAKVLVRHGVRAGVNVIIDGAGEAYGILGAYSRDIASFAQDSIDFMNGVAGLLAGAFQRAATVARSGDQAEFDVQTGLPNRNPFPDRFDPTLRNEMEGSLHQAIERGELELHYQPEISLDSGRIIGVEALLRWRHPVRGLLAAAEFIDAAVELGQVVPIGEWAIDTACAHAAEWHKRGHRDLFVAVNVSPLQLKRGNVAAHIQGALTRSGLDPRYLEIELTETLAVDGGESFIRVIEAIKATGVSIAVDDFGTGYSSLSYLRRYPIDKVKIDRTFVHDIVTDPDAAGIVRAIIAMAHHLRLKVTAEGIETEEQAGFLRRNHCDIVQGYLFGRPVSAAQMSVVLDGGGGPPLLAKPSGTSRVLLLVDDDKNNLRALQRVLRHEGYDIQTATSPERGLEILANTRASVIVSEQRMPGMNGAEFLSRVKKLYPETVRIVLSGFTDLATVTAAVNEGAIYKFLTKPWEDDALREDIRQAFHRYEQQTAPPVKHSP